MHEGAVRVEIIDFGRLKIHDCPGTSKCGELARFRALRKRLKRSAAQEGVGSSSTHVKDGEAKTMQ